MKKILTGIISILLLSFWGLILPLNALAENKGIQISPVTFKFEIKPGESKADKIIVTNRSDEVLNYVIEVEVFEKSSEEGAPIFKAVEPTSGVPSLIDWVVFSESKTGSLGPNQEKEINFTINVPENAEPGGHYGAIFVRQVRSAGSNQIGVATRVGALVLVAVAGDVTKGVKVVEFIAPKIVWKGPVSFKMRVQNTGTVHYDSQAKAVIKNVLGSSSELDLGTHIILPKNIRLYENTWGKKYPFGYYRITPMATDGTGTFIPGTMATMWAIPIVIVGPVIVGLILLILLIRYIRRHVRIVK